ncbi:hypothetical protein K432DRAFT_265384, partial [Lepidopterella palustris CBS 459.81]
MVNRFMVRNKPTPMSWMYDVQTYGMKIRYTTTVESKVGWKGELLIYQDIQFTISEHRTWVHGLTAECRRLVVEELMVSAAQEREELPATHWDEVRDNP